jgi:hypothetical protein
MRKLISLSLSCLLLALLVLSARPQTVVRRPIIVPGGSSLLTNLVASWKLADLTDSVGSNTLTNNNSATFSAGQIGNAVYVASASNQYLSITSNSAVQTGDVDWTIGSWVYLTSTGFLGAAVSKRGDTSGSSEYFIFYFGTNDNLFHARVARPTDSEVDVAASNFGTPNAGTWYCLLVWHDATADTLNISVNNGTANSVATGGALQAASSALFEIGAQASGGQSTFWNGRIDNVNKWSRVLTAGERTRFFNSGVGCEHPFSACP